jgi:hypothetical protein
MNVASKVIIVAGDKGGVGKTTFAKILYDYYQLNNRSVYVIDTEYPDGNISRTIKRSKVVNMDSSRDQAYVLDSAIAAKNAVIVIDMRAGVSSKLLGFLEDIGFLEEAKKGSIDLVLAHVVGSSFASVKEIPEFAKFNKWLKYVSVLSKSNDAHFTSLESAPVEGSIIIEKLDELVFEKIDKLGVTFVEYINLKDSENASFVMKGYARHWFKGIAQQLDKNNVFRYIA